MVESVVVFSVDGLGGGACFGSGDSADVVYASGKAQNKVIDATEVTYQLQHARGRPSR